MDRESCPLSIPESAERVEVKEEPLAVWPGGCSEPVIGGEPPVGECLGVALPDGGVAPLEEDAVEGDVLVAVLSLTLFKHEGRVTFRDGWCPNLVNLAVPLHWLEGLLLRTEECEVL